MALCAPTEGRRRAKDVGKAAIPILHWLNRLNHHFPMGFPRVSPSPQLPFGPIAARATHAFRGVTSCFAHLAVTRHLGYGLTWCGGGFHKSRGSWDIHGISIWVNYNDLTATSLEIMVNKRNHPQMALIQVSEIL
jgi:hypothetical protein